MAIRRLTTEANARGILQIARERAPLLNDAVIVTDNRDGGGYILEKWDTSILGAIPRDSEMAEAATREIIPPAITLQSIKIELDAINNRLQTAGI